MEGFEKFERIASCFKPGSTTLIICSIEDHLEIEDSLIKIASSYSAIGRFKNNNEFHELSTVSINGRTLHFHSDLEQLLKKSYKQKRDEIIKAKESIESTINFFENKYPEAEVIGYVADKKQLQVSVNLDKLMKE